MERAALGRTIGILIRAYDDLIEDPMNDYAGFVPDPMPMVRKMAAQLGWTLAEIDQACKDRGISDRWLYVKGFSQLLHPDGAA